VLPRYALDYTGERFLDELTPAVLQSQLGAPLAFASTLRDVLQIVREPLESQGAAGATVAHSTNGKAWVDFTERTPLGGMGLAQERRSAAREEVHS
jgi:hypothetical protein